MKPKVKDMVVTVTLVILHIAQLGLAILVVRAVVWKVK